MEGTPEEQAAEPSADDLNKQGGALGIEAEVNPETGEQTPPSEPLPSTVQETPGTWGEGEGPATAEEAPAEAEPAAAEETPAEEASAEAEPAADQGE
jgi:hypothetical protein